MHGSNDADGDDVRMPCTASPSHFHVLEKVRRKHRLDLERTEEADVWLWDLRLFFGLLVDNPRSALRREPNSQEHCVQEKFH